MQLKSPDIPSEAWAVARVEEEPLLFPLLRPMMLEHSEEKGKGPPQWRPAQTCCSIDTNVNTDTFNPLERSSYVFVCFDYCSKVKDRVY